MHSYAWVCIVTHSHACLLSREGMPVVFFNNIQNAWSLSCGIARDTKSISCYSNLCEAFRPRFFEQQSHSFEKHYAGCRRTIKSGMQRYDSKPSMLAFWSWKPANCGAFGRVCGHSWLHSVMRDIMRDVQTQRSHYSMRPRADNFVFVMGCG